MKIEYDPVKRGVTLAARGLDMSDAAEVFETELLTIEDNRLDYGESRFMTVGTLKARLVVLIWTSRGASRRIISVRKANAREQAIYDPNPADDPSL